MRPQIFIHPDDRDTETSPTVKCVDRKMPQFIHPHSCMTLLGNLINTFNRLSGRKSRAVEIALKDDLVAAANSARRFSLGTKPVIRWIKGDGLDDIVTRAAIAQATRLFGTQVDYCLCTNGIGADRVRSILEWAAAPVEWWPLSATDNPALAKILDTAGCQPESFGYWWKWFPERARPDAPEWILDGDMVITKIPAWFEKWAAGKDGCRVTQDDRYSLGGLYGRYADMVDERFRLYSGIVSLPPQFRYMHAVERVLTMRPLLRGHDGCNHMCEQGVIAVAFQNLRSTVIPLNEFPFGRAFEDALDFGLRGDQGSAWGYHFGNAFRRDNPHFNRLAQEGTVFSLPERPGIIDRFTWLGNSGQWGIPGWSISDPIASLILEHARAFAGQQILELGTARGRLTAMLASVGGKVTTVDRHDRGAPRNLEGLAVDVVVDDAIHFLTNTPEKFSLIVVDLHGNSEADWQRRGPLLQRCLAPGGTLILNNATLWKIPEWHEETGIRWFLKNLPLGWKAELRAEPLPGLALITAK